MTGLGVGPGLVKRGRKGEMQAVPERLLLLLETFDIKEST